MKFFKKHIISICTCGPKSNQKTTFNLDLAYIFTEHSATGKKPKPSK